MSDIHLEHASSEPVVADIIPADVCVLAGDIIQVKWLRSDRIDAESIAYKHKAYVFFNRLCGQFSEIIWVFGNHEHDDHNMEYSWNVARNFLADHSFNNVTVIEKSWIERRGTIFVGATFWTNFNNGDPLAMLHAQQGMPDYKYIYKTCEEAKRNRRQENTPITVMDTYSDHKIALAAIQQDIRDCTHVYPHVPIVVVTHHPPTFQAISPNFMGNSLNPAFCSDYEGFIHDTPEIKLWACGHTHYKFDTIISTTRVVSNPRGYLPAGQARRFKGNVVIDV